MTDVASLAPVRTRLGAIVRAARDSRPLTSLSGDQLAVGLSGLCLVHCLATTIFFASIGRRWGGNGIFVATMIAILVLGGAVALISFAGGWPAIGSWLTDQPLLALLAGWPLIPSALMLAGGWLVLRRATP